MGCWNVTSVPKIDSPLVDIKLQGKITGAVKKCYLAVKSIGYEVFALNEDGECLSSSNAEEVYQQNGMSRNCRYNGQAMAGAMEVYKIGNLIHKCTYVNTYWPYNYSCSDF